MSNQRLTWDQCAEHFSERVGVVNMFHRANTVVQTGDTRDVFLVYLYGSHIATLYSDGKVMVQAGDWRTNTTRNRLNDVLMPLGWKVDRSKSGDWVIRTLHSPYKSMEFLDGLILSNVHNYERD